MLIQKKNPKTIYKFLSSYHQIGDLIMLLRNFRTYFGLISGITSSYYQILSLIALLPKLFGNYG